MGTFVEEPGDPHIPARQRLLHEQAGLPALPLAPVPLIGSAVATLDPREVRAMAQREGVGAWSSVAPLGDDDLRAFASLLGQPMPELAPAVQPHVVDGVILDLVTDHERTDDVDLQPFAVNELTLHSEGSGRPLGRQPRYIVLSCCEADPEVQARTVVVPMAAVARDLGSRDLEILAGTSSAEHDDTAAIATMTGDGVVFCFRDFAGGALEWVHRGPAGSTDEVNATLRNLLAAMYRSSAAGSVSWRRGLLVVIDNTKVFHGRTAGSVVAGRQARHLKRIRVMEGP